MASSDDPELAEAQRKLEEALTAYMSLSEGKPVMLTGWVLKARGQTTDTVQHQGGAISFYSFGDEQDVFTSLGLADALHLDLKAWYAALYDEE